MNPKSSSTKFSVFEFVFIAVVSVAIGVSFLAWNGVYEFTKPILKIYGLNYLSSGYWILPSVFLSGIIRRPFVAIMASVIAASVEGLFAHWGITALLWGFVQGLGAEIIFLIFAYKKWDLKVMILASILSSLFSFALDYEYYGYQLLSPTLVMTQLTSYVLSSIFLAGVLSTYLTRRLLKIGVLNNFLIAKEKRV